MYPSGTIQVDKWKNVEKDSQVLISQKTLSQAPTLNYNVKNCILYIQVELTKLFFVKNSKYFK